MKMLRSKPKRLYLQFRNRSALVLTDAPDGASFTSFSAAEATREGLAKALEPLRRGCREAVLIASREELLAQEFDAPDSADDLRTDLRRRLETAFPCGLDELSYGIRISEQGSGRVKGTLLAMTRKKLDEAFAPLERAGLQVFEVVPSDEALVFFALSRGISGKALVIDVQEFGAECVLMENGRVRFSKVFKPDGTDLAREIDLALIPFGACERIVLCGRKYEALDAALSGQLQAPVTRLEPELDKAGAEIPASLSGARNFQSEKRASLLPPERKARRRAEERRAAWIWTAGFYAAVFAAFCLAGFVHGKALDWKRASLEAKLASVSGEFGEVRRMRDALRQAGERSRSNDAALSVLAGLSRSVPGHATLTALAWKKSSFTISGECGDNLSVGEVLKAVKELPGVVSARLEYARLKPSETATSTFEFLISAETRS